MYVHMERAVIICTAHELPTCSHRLCCSCSAMGSQASPQIWHGQSLWKPDGVNTTWKALMLSSSVSSSAIWRQTLPIKVSGTWDGSFSILHCPKWKCFIRNVVSGGNSSSCIGGCHLWEERSQKEEAKPSQNVHCPEEKTENSKKKKSSILRVQAAKLVSYEDFYWLMTISVLIKKLRKMKGRKGKERRKKTRCTGP